MAFYLDKNMFEQTPDGKTTFLGGAQIEVVLTNIKINNTARDVITAKVSNVLEVNGEQNPKIKEGALIRVKDIFENRLRTRLETLAAKKQYRDNLFFHEDITQFQLYHKELSFRNFVDN